jgi:hypothetical protein
MTARSKTWYASVSICPAAGDMRVIGSTLTPGRFNSSAGISLLSPWSM